MKEIHLSSKTSDNKRSLNIINATLSLKSRIARFYFYRGGEKNGAGVPLFAKQLATIWHAASQDDPYADLFLLRIYNALQQSRNEIKNKINHYAHYIKNEVNFTGDAVLKDEPHIVPLRFATSYGYMAANLIGDLDEYACLLYTAKVYGIILNDMPHHLLQEVGNKIKDIFTLPSQWINTGVTRQDIVDQNTQAKEASMHMGNLSESILDRSLRSPFAPKIQRKY